MLDPLCNGYNGRVVDPMVVYVGSTVQLISWLSGGSNGCVCWIHYATYVYHGCVVDPMVVYV